MSSHLKRLRLSVYGFCLFFSLIIAVSAIDLISYEDESETVEPDIIAGIETISTDDIILAKDFSCEVNGICIMIDEAQSTTLPTKAITETTSKNNTEKTKTKNAKKASKETPKKIKSSDIKSTQPPEAKQPVETSPVQQEPKEIVTNTHPVADKLNIPDWDTIIKQHLKEPEEWRDTVLTAYCGCTECCGQWYYTQPVDKNGNVIICSTSGDIAVQGVTVAADLNVYPLGTILEIEDYGYRVVLDTGVSGQHLDFYYDNHDDCAEIGQQNRKVRIVGNIYN